MQKTIKTDSHWSKGNFRIPNLMLQILEGKDINPPKLLHSFYTNESYIQVIVSSDTLSMAESTKPEKGGTDPKWNHMLNFQEVPLGSTITFNLMERRKLTADIMLGQVSTSRQSSTPLSSFSAAPI